MMSNKYPPTPEQEEILKNQKEKAIVSASAGTGKTTTLIEYIANLVKSGTPVSRILAVTFTNNSANEMKERLLAKLMEEECSERILQQIDEVLISDISTIHSFFQKIIKRNIEKLAISQDFFLADSNKSNEIKNKAYIKTYEECCEKEEFENLILSLKKETGLLKEIIFKLEQYFSAQENPKQKLAFYIENQREIFKDAEEYLNESLVKKISRIKNKIESVLTEIDTQNKNLQYIENYKKELEKINPNFSLKANIENIFSLEFGRIKDKKSAPSSFLHARDLLEKIKENLKKIPFQEEEFWTPPSFIKSIYDFYNLYIKNLEEIKHNENILDFNDLEKYADELLSQESVAEEIAEEFDYVFIDEYQDTNPVQEKLIKLLSKKAKFMAIGDPKQGIYGFRNATSKIMKKDITEFSKNEGVYYLRKNFRSDSKILDFVNIIFAKIMTKSTTEIDYEGTSMLEGGEFPQTQFPVVRIDLVKKEERQEEMSKLIEYDILADKLEVKDNHKEEAMLISKRISELLLTKIYDPKTNQERFVNYSDIAILVRGKGALSSRIIKQLAIDKIPVISSLEKSIDDNEEIEVVKNYLKIALDIQDDVALVSVLSSKLGGVSLEKLATLRKEESEKKSFYELLKEQEFFQKFACSLDKFKVLCLSKGIRHALEITFSQCDYMPYLLLKKDGINQKIQIEKLLEIIEKSSYNYDIPGLISYLEANELKALLKMGGTNAVLITTIHASKGLEYPIVFLPGMENSILKKGMKTEGRLYKINDRFGLATTFLDFEKNLHCKNILFEAVMECENRQAFVDEIMLLYVAMTRAKNHLYIMGEGIIENILSINEADDVFQAKTYIDIILGVYGEKIKNQKIKNSKAFELNYIQELENPFHQTETLIQKDNDELNEKIRNYLTFEYKHMQATITRYKNSVTSVNSQGADLGREYIGGSENLEVGIAYHKILENLNFEKIEQKNDLINQLKNISYNENLINIELLFEIINKINKITKGNKKVYKEKQFLMKLKQSEAVENGIDEDIMIQGVIDFFSLGEKNILIDYKFTNQENKNILLNKYYKQLYLYEKAIENAFNIKVDEVYLLSLKNAELIRVK